MNACLGKETHLAKCHRLLPTLHTCNFGVFVYLECYLDTTVVCRVPTEQDDAEMYTAQKIHDCN